MTESSPLPIRRLVSGGQTGVDRGALDGALELGFDHGGWCPRGRLAEDGLIPDKYDLRETRSYAYRVRTERNVVESDATLILYRHTIRGGTQFTRYLAIRHGKPYLAVDFEANIPVTSVRDWVIRTAVETLNVAGPRESSCPGIQEQTRRFILELLRGP